MLIEGNCDRLARLRKQSKQDVGTVSTIGEAKEAEKEGTQPSRAAVCSSLCPLCMTVNSYAQQVLLISRVSMSR